MMNHVLAVIMGGGEGTRLRPLTAYRTKPAVPIGGKYRLIDVPVSNCLNSGIGKIFILTQFSSQSLHSHIASTFKFDYFSKSFVRIMAAEQTIRANSWYQGTADAVRKNIMHFAANSEDDDLILILSGDQLYKMDFKEIIEAHLKNKADATICTKIVDKHTAKSCGIMKINKKNKIVEFVEKPQTDDVLHSLQIDNNKFLASMGIYVFNRNILFNLLENSKEDDFGKGVIPEAISVMKVHAHPFDAYWEDIGTIKSFYEVNLGVAAGELEFDFSNIYTHPRFLQPTVITDCTISRSMITEGCVVKSSLIDHSLIGLRSIIGKNCKIIDTVMMGADWYENEKHTTNDIPNIGLGNNVYVKKAIIDKNARIGNNVTIENKNNLEHAEGDNYFIKDGIVIIPKSAVIPDGTII